MGEVKDTILSQSWGQTGQGAGKGGMLGAFPARAPGWPWSSSGRQGPQEGPTSREDSEEEPIPAGSSQFPQQPSNPRRWLVP